MRASAKTAPAGTDFLAEFDPEQPASLDALFAQGGFDSAGLEVIDLHAPLARTSLTDLTEMYDYGLEVVAEAGGQERLLVDLGEWEIGAKGTVEIGNEAYTHLQHNLENWEILVQQQVLKTII